ncbi:late competence protein ComER [Bacillus tianshenii]|nr:late competence protein ComER [Bacillus tianshenii]
MKIGMIGTGNMGTILTEAFAESNALATNQLLITNRTIEKAERLKEKYPELQLMPSAEEIIEEADYIFICVKPLEFYSLLSGREPEELQGKCFISITSPVHTEELETMLQCPVIRAVPSITNRAHSGATLVTFGEMCQEQQKKDVLTLLEAISTPIIVDNDYIRMASDLASCAPAFFSYLVQAYIDAAVEQTNISKEKATLLASQMLIGVGTLLEKQVYTLPSLQEKVCVKGGVTGEGIKVLEKHAAGMFEELVKVTHDKYAEDRENITTQFNTYIN